MGILSSESVYFIDKTQDMAPGKNNFWVSPSPWTVTLFGTAWLLSSGLLLVATTDFFQHSPFRGENLLIGLLWLLATRTTAQVGYRYFRQQISD